MTAAPKAGTMFQSTPPSGERSDARKQVLELAEAQFQSTPPSGERSDFSVRCGCLRLALFQSTPPSGERSDPRRGAWRPLVRGFNPRPPPERGATRLQPLGFELLHVSIHAPLRREERLQKHRPPVAHVCVSIHAPLRREERLRARTVSAYLDRVSIHAPLRREERRSANSWGRNPWQFQSTPPSGERSDVRVLVAC